MTPGDPAAPAHGTGRLRRTRSIAAATLGAVMAAHMLLETGRDALFLANVAVERLPILTIAIAFLALGISRLDGGLSHRRTLFALQLFAAGGTLVLWSFVSSGADWIYHVLYVWSGIVTSLIVIRFWLLLGDLFTIFEGKREFAAIAMGGAIGALLGSAVGALAAPRVGGAGLLALAVVGYVASALGPLALREPQRDPVDGDAHEPETSWRESLRALRRSPYAGRVALLVMVGGMTLSFGDYLFKSVLAGEVDAERLAVWLSRIYLGLNALSITVLAFGVTPVVRRLGVDRSLAVLPVLVSAAAGGVLAGGALVATIFLKLADGTLRYSLHQTATELLYLPMTSSLRRAVKTSIDLVGQTGARALASLLILALVLLPHPTLALALVLLAMAGLWIRLALGLRETYLAVFRDALGEGMIETALEHPELDLASAGSLLRALSDPDESHSLAALRLLIERGQLDLVPSLILYHPSPRVVELALDELTRAGRDDVEHLLDVLIDHDDAGVRAATVRARWALDQDLDAMRAYDQSECLAVRLSAFAGLLSAGEIEPSQYEQVLGDALAYETSEPRLAAATAARLYYHPVNREALVRMATDEDVALAREAVRAMRASDDPWFTPHLVDLLGQRRVREDVRRALLERGEAALEELASRLGSERTPRSIHAHIPRAMARFGTAAAVSRLIEGLAKVESGLLRFQLLRGLETLLDPVGSATGRPALRARDLDLTPLRAELDRTLARSQRLLELERALAAAQAADPERATVGGSLLVDLLRDKRVLATGRLFRMLDLLHPREDFRAIQEGLRSASARDRASAAELVETLLAGNVAEALLDLVEGRRSRGPRAATPYGELIERVQGHGSETLGAVALYHADELGLAVSGATDGAAAGTAAGRAEGGLAAVRALFDRDARLATAG